MDRKRTEGHKTPQVALIISCEVQTNEAHKRTKIYNKILANKNIRLKMHIQMLSLDKKFGNSNLDKELCLSQHV
jgi:hypothetical protein